MPLPIGRQESSVRKRPKLNIPYLCLIYDYFEDVLEFFSQAPAEEYEHTQTLWP